MAEQTVPAGLLTVTSRECGDMVRQKVPQQVDDREICSTPVYV